MTNIEELNNNLKIKHVENLKCYNDKGDAYKMFSGHCLSIENKGLLIYKDESTEYKTPYSPAGGKKALEEIVKNGFVNYDEIEFINDNEMLGNLKLHTNPIILNYRREQIEEHIYKLTNFHDMTVEMANDLGKELLIDEEVEQYNKYSKDIEEYDYAIEKSKEILEKAFKIGYGPLKIDRIKQQPMVLIPNDEIKHLLIKEDNSFLKISDQDIDKFTRTDIELDMSVLIFNNENIALTQNIKTDELEATNIADLCLLSEEQKEQLIFFKIWDAKLHSEEEKKIDPNIYHHLQQGNADLKENEIINNEKPSINNFDDLYKVIENDFIHNESRLNKLYVSPEVLIAMIELENQTDAIWIYEKEDLDYEEGKGFLIEMNVRYPEDIKKSNYKDIITDVFFEKGIGVGNIKEDALEYLKNNNNKLKI